MNGRVESRFEVGHHLEGLIATAMTRAEAIAIAENWIRSDTGYPDAEREVRVYDSMARNGMQRRWAKVLGKWIPM